ncbi:thymidine phosphorylase [Cycloclasticus sp. 46_83_sub15_T18]|nr:thymidine phosphorylase [Cycloclasticus sp. 46_83_sub15_T18]
MQMEKKKLIRSSGSLLEVYLQQRLLLLFDKVESGLNDAAAEGNTASILADISVLKQASKGLSLAFIGAVSKNILSFSDELIGKEKLELASFSSVTVETGLSLLAIDEVENKLLLEGYISGCEGRLSKLLHALRSRIEFVTKTDGLNESKNPFGPSVLMNSYADLIQAESFSQEVENILYQSFSEIVLSGLGEVLDTINELFIDAGVLPKIPIKRSRSVVNKGANTASPVHPVQQPAYSPQQFSSPLQQLVNPSDLPATAVQNMAVANTQLDPVLYGNLLGMAQAYRGSAGENVQADGLQVAGEQLPTNELISTLTSIQHAGADTQQSVRAQIGTKIQVDGQRQPYAEQDDTLIDVVAMFFDVILQDRHLPDVVRAMIAQLQIPILKVAMMDKDFFAKKSHPARQFLNALSQAGLGVSEKNTKIKNSVFEKMESLVARVLMDFDSDIVIFADLFAEFELFMQQQQRQVDVIEERSRAATRSSEQLELTKRKAAYEVALRLNGQTIPEFVQVFLDSVWNDVLVLALLRHEREPQEVGKCLQVIERLLCSVNKPGSVAEKKAILANLGRLLKDLKVGLENISYDFHQSSQFFKELESWHRHLLLAASDEQTAELEAGNEVSMVDFAEELSMASLEESLLHELESEQSAMPNDKFSKRSNKMQVGDWIEYNNEAGELLRAKLSWKSSVTSSCLFVDDRGGKALDVKLVDFAEALREKKIRLLGQEKEPLVERVLAGMKNFIKGRSTEASVV